jgi:hypothetical protein
MLTFDYRGRDWRAKNRVRRFLVVMFLLICAILLFPFVLLNLLFWGIWRLGDRISRSGVFVRVPAPASRPGMR